MTGYSEVRYDDHQHKAAPRSPFSFAGRAGRAARALTSVASALALATGVLALAPAPAHADDAVPSQEYFSYYHFDTARAKGYTGKGITIAAIGGPVDTSNPALKGANITDKSRCTAQAAPEGVRHGTDMAIILVSPISGVAPDATLYTYQSSTATTTSNGSCDSNGDRLNTIAALINQAVEDGAQIISISQSVSEHSNQLKWAITNAISKGVIIVNSAGNGASDDNITQLGRFSGVVGVSAINSDGSFASLGRRRRHRGLRRTIQHLRREYRGACHRTRHLNIRPARGRHVGPGTPKVARCHPQPDPPTPRPHSPEPKPRLEPANRIWPHRWWCDGQYGPLAIPRRESHHPEKQWL